MIAGTSFQLLDDVKPVWSRLLQRIARTNSPIEVMDLAVRACENADAIPMLCPDGLVIMTLCEAPDGTITMFLMLGASFGDAGAFYRQEAALVAIAKDAGASRLAFRTDRKGWKRLLGPQWQLDGEVFSRSL